MIVSPRSLVIEDLIGLLVQSMYVGSAYYFGGFDAFIYLICSAILGQGLHVSAIHFIAEHYLITPESAFTRDPDHA
jgi:hypothetical protein